MVKPLKIKVPEFVIAQLVVAMVMVPLEGVRLPPETSRVLLTVKSLEVLGLPVIVRLLKTKLLVDPPLLIIEPPVKVIIPAVGARVLPELTVKAPETEKSAVGCGEAVPSMVKPLNVKLPGLEIPQLVPVMVIMPSVGARVLPELTVKVPEIEKLWVGCVEGVASIVKPLKTRVPEELLMAQAALDMVIVLPTPGEKLPEEPMVKVPAILKEAVVVTVAEAAMEMPWKVKELLLTIEAPLLKVIVPEEGVKTPEAPTVKVPLPPKPTLALLAPVEIALVLMINLP